MVARLAEGQPDRSCSVALALGRDPCGAVGTGLPTGEDHGGSWVWDGEKQAVCVLGGIADSLSVTPLPHWQHQTLLSSVLLQV